MATKNIRKHSLAAIAAMVLIGAATSANAVLLNPGNSGPNASTPTEPASTQVGLVTIGNFGSPNITDINAGSKVTEYVFRNNVTGFLDFYFQVSSAAGPLNGLIHQFNANFFGGYTTNVFWDDSPKVAGVITQAGNPLNGLLSGTVIPDTFARSNSGDAIQFNFPDLPAPNGGSGPLASGGTSKWLVVRTNATQAGPGVGGVINGITQNFPLVGPVPEPGSLLFGLGVLGAMGTRSIRRRKTA